MIWESLASQCGKARALQLVAARAPPHRPRLQPSRGPPAAGSLRAEPETRFSRLELIRYSGEFSLNCAPEQPARLNFALAAHWQLVASSSLSHLCHGSGRYPASHGEMRIRGV